MNLNNKYIDTMFSPMYFSEELELSNYNKSIYFIRDEYNTAEFNDFSVHGRSNVILLKTKDIIDNNVEEDNQVKIQNIEYTIKSLKNNNNGTTTAVLEKI